MRETRAKEAPPADRAVRVYIEHAGTFRFSQEELHWAAKAIAAAWRLRTEGQGYAASSTGAAIPCGRQSAAGVDLLKAYDAWAMAAQSEQRGIVLDLAVFGFTLAQVAAQRDSNKDSVQRKCRQGLGHYCFLRGKGKKVNLRLDLE